MSDVESGLSLEAVSRRLRGERSLSKKRAVFKSLSLDWFLDNVEGIVVSPEKVLRQQLIAACVARPERLPAVLSVLRQRTWAPVPNAATAEAVCDSIVSVLAAGRLAKQLKQRLSVVERAQLIVTAIFASVGHSLTPHPRLKGLLKDRMVGHIAFADRGVPVEARRLILKLVPDREGYVDLVVSGVRRGDEEMLRFLSTPGLPFVPEETRRAFASAGHALVTSPMMRLEERAQWLGTIAGTVRDAFDPPSLMGFSNTLYRAAASTADRFRVSRRLVHVLEEAEAKPGEAPGIDEVHQALLRLRRIPFQEFVATIDGAPSEGERVAWFLHATGTAKEAQDLSTDEVRTLARAAVRATVRHPEILAHISADLPKGPRLSAWWDATLDEVEALLTKEIPSQETARAVGAGILSSDSKGLRERLLDLFLKSPPDLRDFWAVVLNASGIAQAWHALVSGHVAETQAEASERDSEEVRQGFARGYARATVIFQEKLKALARAAAQVTEEISRSESSAILRSVLNDMLTVLGSVGIKRIGEIGEATVFDPAVHEDASGTLAPGDPAIIAGIGFVIETTEGSQENLRKLKVRARSTGR